MPEQNKRGFTRVETHVEAEVCVESGAPVPCRVDNLSLNGVMLSGGHGFAEGSVCSVHLVLSGAEPSIEIVAKGLVIRVRPDRTAIEFREIDGDSYTHLRNLVLANADDAESVEEEFDASVGIKKTADEF